MNILLVGLGKVGSYLAGELAQSRAHNIVAVEKSEKAVRIFPGSDRVRVIQNDGCEPAVLEEAGVRNADLVVATTGDDEDNLVIAQLAKLHFGAPRVIARVNNPRNHWLFTKEWGVDVAVSPTDIITKIIEEEMSLGDLVTLLKLRGGEMALAEIMLTPESRAAGKVVSELGLPPGVILAVVMREKEIIVPGGDTRLQAGDELLALTSVAKEQALLEVLQ